MGKLFADDLAQQLAESRRLQGFRLIWFDWCYRRAGPLATFPDLQSSIRL